MNGDPMISQKKMPSDDVPRRMMTLLLEMLKSGDDDELLIGGAWTGLEQCLLGRPLLGPTVLECGMFEMVVAQLNALGSPADWVSLSRARGKAGRAGRLFQTLLSNVYRSFTGRGGAAGPSGLCLQRAV